MESSFRQKNLSYSRGSEPEEGRRWLRAWIRRIVEASLPGFVASTQSSRRRLVGECPSLRRAIVATAQPAADFESARRTGLRDSLWISWELRTQFARTGIILVPIGVVVRDSTMGEAPMACVRA